MVRQMENRPELCEIVGRRAWFNVPVADIQPRLMGDYNYGLGRGGSSPHLMKFWRDFASYPYQATSFGSSPKTSAGASSIPSSMPSADRQVNRGTVARSGRNAGRAGGRDPCLDLPRQGNLVRRQGLRSGKPSAYLASLAIKHIALTPATCRETTNERASSGCHLREAGVRHWRLGARPGPQGAFKWFGNLVRSVSLNLLPPW